MSPQFLAALQEFLKEIESLPAEGSIPTEEYKQKVHEARMKFEEAVAKLN